MTLEQHTAVVEDGGGLRFSDVYNTAVPFIDRHVDDGRADKAAIRTRDGQTVRYGQLLESVNRCGRWLLAQGLGAGDRLLMVVQDEPAFFYAFWGAVKAGIVPVPLNTLWRADDYRYVLDDSAGAGLIYSPALSDAVLAATRLAEGQLTLLAPTQGPDGLLEALPDASDDLSAHPARPDDDCFWLYSSGSTGRPKGAVHAHRAIAVTAERYGVQTLGLSESDVCYSAAKLFFAYGFGNAMTFPLWVGGTSVLTAARPTPALTFEMVSRFGASLYFGVPTLYAAQLEALAGDEPDLSTLRRCVSAGEALPPSLLEGWRARVGLPILDGIGSTEALHIFISNRPDDVRPGSSGRLVPGYEARLVDDAGRDAEVTEGSLQVRGASLAKYYWNKPDKTAATMVDGWLVTGDRYRRDDQRYWIYQGRNDDMLKVGGIWCSPFEIEARLVAHPAVLEAAVVGRADDAGLTKPEAWLVLREGVESGPELEAELKAHCQAGLAPYKYPRWFRVVSELPKTATGKTRRFVLRHGGTD